MSMRAVSFPVLQPLSPAVWHLKGVLTYFLHELSDQPRVGVGWGARWGSIVRDRNYLGWPSLPLSPPHPFVPSAVFSSFSSAFVLTVQGFFFHF